MKVHTLFGVVVLLSLVSCGRGTQLREKAPVRVCTEVLTASDGDGSVRTYVGLVEENAATAVSFTTMGSVRRVLVSEGQTVSRGQLLAELDDTQARNLLDVARAGVVQAEDALKRYGQLHEKGSMTDAQWVEVQSKVAQARSQVAVAEKNLADCRLLAPVAGIIGRKNINAGETAMPSVAVVTILDISAVKVRFSVPEAEMADITPRASARADIEAINRQFACARLEKGVQADALTHTYDVRAYIDNKERAILPGMVAKVSVHSSSASHAAGGVSASAALSSPEAGASVGAVSIPVTSVQRRADGTLFVWTVSSDTAAHRSPVTIGSVRGNQVEILSGLTVGQRIVTEGYQKLSEGTKVTY